MLKKGDGVAGTIPVLAQRAASEGPRWTRAVGIIPPTPYKAAARCGLADGLFEHPAFILSQTRSVSISLRVCSMSSDEVRRLGANLAYCVA